VKTVTVALTAAAVMAGGVTAAPPGPPQIRESLTPLPCPAKPKTTLQLEACAGQRILRTDAEINHRVRTIWGLLKTHPARARFAAAERAWLAYRRASCSSLGDAFKGGTLAKIKYAECVGDVNRQHIRQLIQFETALRGR
jgi:uncharacterized protein YecT (DUF1311 family)